MIVYCVGVVVWLCLIFYVVVFVLFVLSDVVWMCVCDCWCEWKFVMFVELLWLIRWCWCWWVCCGVVVIVMMIFIYGWGVGLNRSRRDRCIFVDGYKENGGDEMCEWCRLLWWNVVIEWLVVFICEFWVCGFFGAFERRFDVRVFFRIRERFRENVCEDLGCWFFECCFFVCYWVNIDYLFSVFLMFVGICCLKCWFWRFYISRRRWVFKFARRRSIFWLKVFWLCELWVDYLYWVIFVNFE